MTVTDSISDMLTRIRNAAMVSKPWVDIPCSNQKIRILYILKEEHKLYPKIIKYFCEDEEELKKMIPLNLGSDEN